MKAFRRGTFIAIGAAATLTLSVVPAASASTTDTLTNEVIPGLTGLLSQGSAPSTQKMQLAIEVKGDQAAAQKAYDAIYTKGSPQYHHFLSAQQVTDQFGAPADRWNATQSWLKDKGLDVTYASGSRDLLAVSGPVSAVQDAFGVQIKKFKTGNRDFIANTSAPKVPSSLGITHVVGLNTLDGAKAADPHTQAAGLPGSVNIKQLWGAYKADTSDTQGAGQSTGVLGAGATDGTLSDLTKFEDKYGLPHVNTEVDHVGDGPFTDTSGAEEWAMDTQSMTGMAPKTDKLKLYFGKDLSDAAAVSIISSWESDPDGPKQADASWGECEETPLNKPLSPIINPLNQLLSGVGAGVGLQNDLQAVADPILQKATLEGKTLFVSSGDTGSSCPLVYVPVVGAGNGLVNQVVPFLNYPASSPYTVGVGGTTLSVNGSDENATRGDENAWSFGGGGESWFQDAPKYQQGVKNLNLPGIDGKTASAVPDVSAMSGDAISNNMTIISGGSEAGGAGTSLSSPLWAGMWSRIQADAGDQGFANETLYPLGKNDTTDKRDFYDVTKGIGGVPSAGNGLYLSQPGWDYATGWGTPNVSSIVSDVKGQG